MDIRVKRTYKMLFEALTKLLAENDYEEITVAEICAESTVHRTTFYKHFDDKYDFYRAYLEYLTQGFLDRAPAGSELDSLDVYICYMQEALLDFIENTPGIKKYFMNRNSKTSNFDIVIEYMSNDLCKRLELMDSLRNSSRIPSAEIQAMSTYYTGGLLQLIKWWLTNDKPCTKQKLIEQTAKLAKFPGFTRESRASHLLPDAKQ